MARRAAPPSKTRLAWHAAFLAMLPKIRLHARISFRHLDPEARAEAVQEAVCNAMVAFQRLWRLGKANIAYPTVLARYAVNQTKDFRKVGGHLNIKDVSSPYCQKRKGVVMERLDKFDHVNEEWEEIVLEDRTTGPADIARVRLDFAAWLRSLPRRLRRIAKVLATGEGTHTTARKFGVSDGRISQVRKELAESWRAFVGDPPLDGGAALAAA